jgi:hypothetical protein
MKIVHNVKICKLKVKFPCALHIKVAELINIHKLFIVPNMRFVNEK